MILILSSWAGCFVFSLAALESLLLAEICNYPPRQNHQRDNHGNQKQPVRGFPNQDFADGHCGVLSTSLPLGSPSWASLNSRCFSGAIISLWEPCMICFTKTLGKVSFTRSSTISASAVLPVAIAVPSRTDGLGFVRSDSTGPANSMCLGAMSVASSAIP